MLFTSAESPTKKAHFDIEILHVASEAAAQSQREPIFKNGENQSQGRGLFLDWLVTQR
jgi:hypothetical protein